LMRRSCVKRVETDIRLHTGQLELPTSDTWELVACWSSICGLSHQPSRYLLFVASYRRRRDRSR
jgi:hypothetical protein